MTKRPTQDDVARRHWHAGQTVTPIAHADTAEDSKLLPHAEAHLSAHAFIGVAMCLALYELPDWVDGLISIGHVPLVDKQS